MGERKDEEDANVPRQRGDAAQQPGEDEITADASGPDGSQRSRQENRLGVHRIEEERGREKGERKGRGPSSLAVEVVPYKLVCEVEDEKRRREGDQDAGERGSDAGHRSETQ